MMLYEIDESCLAVLNANDRNAIAFFEQLALDRRKCKNIIIAKRDVFAELAKIDGLSILARDIYRLLGKRVSEHKLILRKTKKYCKIVANAEETIVLNSEHEIIVLPIGVGAFRDFTSKTVMLAENEEDVLFYRFIGQYFIRQNKIGNINIDFEEGNGGGSTTSNVLQRIIEEKNRMCLCIVDSDKKYKNAANGDTMKRVISVTKNIVQDYFEVMLLEIHEIENLIPISVLEKMVNTLKLNKQGVDFMRVLVDKDGTYYSPVFYFDLKKGIPRSAYFIEKDAPEEKQKKFRRLEAYRQYWKAYIEAFGLIIEEGEDDTIISGVSEKILKNTLIYLENIKQEGVLESIIIEPYLKEVWMAIGEKVYCWGCVGNRIAV